MNTLRLILITAIAITAATWAQAKRVALVIGNSAYEKAQPLKNPANDAADMAEKFRSLGFETVVGYDLDYDGMFQVMREFARTARDAEIATIFYAGHGIAVDGVNYLVPIDASLDDPLDWEYQVYPLEDFLRVVRHTSGASLVFLDACRDNPLAEVLARSMGRTTRSMGSRGLARVNAQRTGSGMAIAYATSPGDVAQDGQGNNSPFTTALLKHIGAANTDITEVMSYVTGDVLDSTNHEQRPWVDVSLTGPVVLNKVDTQVLQTSAPAAGQPAAAPAAGNAELQQFMFQMAQESGDPADYRAYIDQFPNGIFGQMARNAIQRHEAAEAQLAAAAAPVTTLALPTAPNVGRDLGLSLGQPLRLEVNDAVRQSMSNQQTETALALTRDQRRAIQGRLNAISLNVGGTDGNFGPKTRVGIQSWQAQNGLVPTGFLNMVQHQLLTANTETAFRTYLTHRPLVSAQSNTRRRTSSGSSSTRRRTSSNNNNAAAVAVGVVAACILFC